MRRRSRCFLYDREARKIRVQSLIFPALNEKLEITKSNG